MVASLPNSILQQSKAQADDDYSGANANFDS